MVPEPDRRIVYRFSSKAFEVLGHFNEAVNAAKHLPGASDAFKSHLNKYPEIFGRLCLTFHVAKALASGRPEDMEVSSKVAEAAFSLLLEHCMPMGISFYAKLGYSGQIDQAVLDVASFILACCEDEKTIDTRTLTRRVTEVRANADAARKTMAVLESFGWVRECGSWGGKPTRWEISPVIHEKYRARVEQERKKREENLKNLHAALELFGKGKVNEVA